MVDPARNGAMGVGKKYRGTLDKALVQYATDQLAGRKDLKLDRVFITHSGMSPERIEMVKKTVEQLAGFRRFLSPAQAAPSPPTVGRIRWAFCS